MFEIGQMMTAFARVKTLSGIWIEGYNPSVAQNYAQPYPEVVERFYAAARAPHMTQFLGGACFRCCAPALEVGSRVSCDSDNCCQPKRWVCQECSTDNNWKCCMSACCTICRQSTPITSVRCSRRECGALYHSSCRPLGDVCVICKLSLVQNGIADPLSAATDAAADSSAAGAAGLPSAATAAAADSSASGSRKRRVDSEDNTNSGHHSGVQEECRSGLESDSARDTSSSSRSVRSRPRPEYARMHTGR